MVEIVRIKCFSHTYANLLAVTDPSNLGQWRIEQTVGVHQVGWYNEI